MIHKSLRAMQQKVVDEIDQVVALKGSPLEWHERAQYLDCTVRIGVVCVRSSRLY